MDQERCPHHFGPISECPDDERDWFPQRSICWPTAQLEAAKRLFALLHEEQPYHDGTFQRWAKEPSAAYPFHYGDGHRFYLTPSDIAPWDEWTTDVNASPDKPDGWGESVAQKSERDQDEPTQSGDQGHPPR